MYVCMYVCMYSVVGKCVCWLLAVTGCTVLCVCVQNVGIDKGDIPDLAKVMNRL